MNRKNRLIFLVILMLLAWPLVCRAEVTRFYFNVCTTQYPDLVRLDITVQISDTQYRAADALKSLTVTAPNEAKTVLNLLNPNCWNELRSQYEAFYLPTDFPEGKIPAGKYVAKLKDKSDRVLAVNETINASLLPFATIIYPTEGPPPTPALTTLKPTIKWTKVRGAQVYQMQLFNDTDAEWIYMIGPRASDAIYTNQFTIQTGVLKPDKNYRVRIEARDSDKNMNRRSRSDLVHFSTAADAK